MSHAVAAPEAPADPPVDDGPALDAAPITPHFTADIPWSSAPGEPDADQGEEEPEAPDQQEPPPPEEPAPAADETPPSDFDYENLTDEQLKAIEQSPRLKERIRQLANNELGNRLQRERDAIRSEERNRIRESDKKFSEATRHYNEIEALRDEDPDAYEEWQSDSANLRWRAAYLDWAKERGAELENAGKPPAQPAFDPAVHGKEFVSEFQTIIRESVDNYDSLPAPVRNAIGGLQFGEGWMQGGLKTLLKGIQAEHAKQIKEQVAAAREAGRNEAMADRDDDSPVVVSNQRTSRNADDIVARHAYGEDVDPADLAWAYKKKGMSV